MRSPRTPRRRDAASPQTAAAFNPGDPVEVLPDEPGLRGAYLAAVVVGPSTKPRGYTVEYDALVESEGSDRKLREALPARSLRPRPPPLRAPASGDVPAAHASVDALHDDAWWLGVALGAADGAGKVKVCFPETREVMEFDAADIRPHLEWTGGEWCSPDSMVRVSITSDNKLLIHEEFRPSSVISIIKIRPSSGIPNDFTLGLQTAIPYGMLE
jgi:hypothetical protein